MLTNYNTLPRINWETQKLTCHDSEGNFQEFYLPDATRGALILFLTRVGFCHNSAFDMALTTLKTFKDS